MKRAIIIHLFAVGVFATGAAAHDGQVNITGTIQGNTCIVDTDSKNMTVDMGTVASKQFYEAGVTTAARPFTIKLVKCGDAASAVGVTFHGTLDGKDNRLATGMGIALLDLNRQLIPLNTESIEYPLTPGAQTVTLDFYAQYMANGATVTSGRANATATFVLNYA